MANMFWDEDDDNYKMDHANRGRAIIINNQEFSNKTRLSTRRGSDVDARQIGKQFHRLGFDVQIFHNLKKADMMQLMVKASKWNHSTCDCFVSVILSHGLDGVVYGYDGTINISELLDPFKGHNCPTLVGKPKLFFIQACRGDKLDPGVEMTDGLDESGYDEVDAIHQLQKIPTEADFMIAYSVVPGYYSWRHSREGSWFIQALVQVLEKYGTVKDLQTIMTKVNRKVAYDFESRSSEPHMSHQKQIPSIVSMLTKLVYFHPK